MKKGVIVFTILLIAGSLQAQRRTRGSAIRTKETTVNQQKPSLMKLRTMRDKAEQRVADLVKMASEQENAEALQPAIREVTTDLDNINFEIQRMQLGGQ